ncbi:Porphobilinogen deaminase [Rubrobacter xylanophilus DSM 9941]|uniref:hydroxymethylbilane synthase n=1 Tax=Rubrobacter xylanophilus TaxID=49319 RepID=UPI001C64179D|nr:hydroxymethylbilane synthase [Rubrobacter xylanophilus]QYJ15114.1 Porphobilinogen deaminase [Rubrobacter xylanophilus DSM 9941]
MAGRLVLGTRGSPLALIQAGFCAAGLRRAGFEVELRRIRTTSDRRPDVPLSVIDQRDVFTRQLDEALLAGEVDLAVHSMKDVPTGLPGGIALAAVAGREDPSDVLVSEEGWTVDGLPEGARVATSSLRRRAQLLHRRPDLRIVEIRGNVDTRIRKVREGAAEALVLARAGLERLGLEAPRVVVPHEILLPAAGQGALAVAMRSDDPRLREIRRLLNDPVAERAVEAERSLLRELGGGCRVPVGAYAVVAGGRVRLRGSVVSPDGRAVCGGEESGEEPEEVGRTLARRLLERGADEILDCVGRVRL